MFILDAQKLGIPPENLCFFSYGLHSTSTELKGFATIPCNTFFSGRNFLTALEVMKTQIVTEKEFSLATVYGFFSAIKHGIHFDKFFNLKSLNFKKKCLETKCRSNKDSYQSPSGGRSRITKNINALEHLFDND